MKYLLPILLIAFSFSLSYTNSAFAQATISPTFFCVGNNPQPPCVTVAPSTTIITPTVFLNSPSVSPSPSGSQTNPSTSPNPSGATVSNSPSGSVSPSVSPSGTPSNGSTPST